MGTQEAYLSVPLSVERTIYCQEWLPIESAPKDREVLLWFECRDVQDDPIIDKCYWDNDAWVIAGECGCRLSRPPAFYTHWMPLPAAPK